ncbi:phosphatidylserine decarboxylase [Nitrospirillum amazonense]|uniref:Phosphatidylserine decarboxylase proenzyme n=1 Tax=Nitrospirillum amazonense TaxID=28077 RepID=A0A560K8X9_9PROT|nr:phosphatidylserine decarboxylase [Nitrospirillum amazonense]MDG3441791.1 phosphatidylserine decarboxylase [Nitrospirillum amazonense]TWB79717.1 phosphatidylserine decarboxylase [Nitrospirillum amazonense]
MSALSTVIVPINRAGWPFILAFAVVTLILFWLSTFLGWIGVILTAWCAYFFRDPDRVVPTRPGLMVSPADGLVQMITKAVPPPELGMGPEPLTRISIFLNVFNVHINRTPIEGTVTRAEYHPGKFLNAALDKASDLNERMSIRLAMPDGREIAFVQIAGLVARRIICTLKPGQSVSTGERYGLIRFGSRTDVYLPDGVQPLVVVGQKALGGETILADLASAEPQRQGVVR